MQLILAVHVYTVHCKKRLVTSRQGTGKSLTSFYSVYSLVSIGKGALARTSFFKHTFLGLTDKVSIVRA
jgi:hypothetical protein